MRLLETLSIIFLDQITKYIVITSVKGKIKITSFFNIVCTKNKGVIFGLMSNLSFFYVLIIAINLAAIAILLIWSFRLGNNLLASLGISFIIGGAIGNFIDRIIYGAVIDFLDFHIGKYHWPAFNIADSAITFGTILLAIGLFSKDASKSV